MILLRAAPRPEPGELLASWVGRLACLYGAPPEALWHELARVDRGVHQSSTDAPTTDELAPLAAAARLEVSALIATTVDAMLPIAPAGWLRARGPVLSDLPWCPVCLQDDRRRGRVPHLRRLWAVACVAVCPHHQMPLTDICPACAQHTRAGFCWVRSHPIVVCTICGADLARGRTTAPALAGGVPTGCPPEAIVGVTGLQTRLLRALRACSVAPDAFTDAVEVLAGHLLFAFAIERLAYRVAGAADRCRFANLSTQQVFMVLTGLSALLALPAAAIESELADGVRAPDEGGAPISPVRLWTGTASSAVLHVEQRHWFALASKVGAAVFARLLGDPEMIAYQNGCPHAVAWRRAEQQRYHDLARRILANPAMLTRLAAGRTPGERITIMGQLARETLAEDQATRAAPPVAANA